MCIQVCREEEPLFVSPVFAMQLHVPTCAGAVKAAAAEEVMVVKRQLLLPPAAALKSHLNARGVAGVWRTQHS